MPVEAVTDESVARRATEKAEMELRFAAIAAFATDGTLREMDAFVGAGVRYARAAEAERQIKARVKR